MLSLLLIGASPAFYMSLGVGNLRAARAQPAITTHVTPSPGTFAFGIPETFESPGIALLPQPATTVVVSFGVRATEHISVEANLGVPPLVDVRGAGIAAPPGPSNAVFRLDLADPSLNPLATQRQWSPVLSAQYAFGPSHRRLRPYLGGGVTYTWFTDERLNPAFANALDQRFGQPLATGAAKAGPTSSRLEVHPLWAGAVSGGARLALGPRFQLAAALSWAPLNVRSVLTLRAADGSTLSRTQARVSIDGVIGTLTLAYSFRAREFD